MSLNCYILGASDDAVACSVLLEIFRAIMADKRPLLHPLIFLFNGAEETILQASHGFITQHKWVDQVSTITGIVNSRISWIKMNYRDMWHVSELLDRP